MREQQEAADKQVTASKQVATDYQATMYDPVVIKQSLDHFLEAIYFLEQHELEVFGLNWKEIYLLQLLQRKPGQYATDLAEQMKVKPFVVSRMLEHLEAAGFVLKEKSLTDKRFYHLRMTDAGMDKLNAIDAMNYQIVTHQLKQMSEDHGTMILSVLDRLGDLLKLPE